MQTFQEYLIVHKGNQDARTPPSVRVHVPTQWLAPKK